MKKQMVETPDEQLGFLLMQTYLLKQRIINSALKEHHLTYVQFVILAGIYELSASYESVTQQLISDERRLDKAMVSNVVKTLIDREFIIRQTHPDDNRAWVLRLTKAGEKAAIQGKKTTKDIDTLFFAKIDGEKLKEVFKKLLSENSC